MSIRGNHVSRAWLVAVSCLMILQLGVAQGQTLNGLFEGKDPAVYVRNMKQVDQDATLVTADDLDRQTVLRVTYDNRSFVELRPVKVQASQCYELTFKARWQNKETIENNPTFEAALDLNRLVQVDVLPAAMLSFLDENQKPLSGDLLIMLLHGKWQDYQVRFQAPADAAYVIFKVMAGRNLGQLFVASPVLAPEAHKGMVLRFKQKNKDVSGNAFGLKLDGMIRSDSDNTLLLRTGPDQRTASIFIGPPGDYQLSIKGTNPGKANGVSLLFINAANRQMDYVSLRETDDQIQPFTLPEGAIAIQLRIRDKWLDEIHIEPAK